MPNIETHCDISKLRTRETYKELHEWIDAPSKELGVNHRIERHSDNEIYREYIKERWGKRAVIEWLFHIAIDNLHTAYKASKDEYKERTFNFHSFFFSGSNDIIYECGLRKEGFTNLPGRGISTYELPKD